MAVFIYALFLIVFISVYKATDDWFSPSRLHTLMWFVFFLGYILLMGGNLGLGGIIWLMLSCLVMMGGEIVGKRIKLKKIQSDRPVDAYPQKSKFYGFTLNGTSWWILFGIIFLGLIGVFSQLEMYGYDLSVFFDMSKFLEMNNAIAADRYSGNGETSMFVTFLSAFRYAGTLCGGYAFVYAKDIKKKVLCIGSLVPSALDMAINNTKVGMIASVFLFAIGFMIAYNAYYGELPKMKLKYVLGIVGGLLLLFLALFLSMMAREGTFNKETFQVIKEKFVIYALAQVETFDYWFCQVYETGTYTFGTSTFMAPFALLGLVEKKQGIYDFLEGMDSNIFTGYRGVISDFGIVGGLIFMFILGMIGGYARERVKRGQTSIWLKAFYDMLYAFVLFTILYSFVVSPWVYTVYWFAVILFFAYSLLAQRKVFFKNKNSFLRFVVLRDRLGYIKYVGFWSGPFSNDWSGNK